MREMETHTALRGVAALSVVVYHYWVTLPPGFALDGVTHFIDSTKYFVDFFFVLSGFVIACVYMDRIMNGASALSEYLLARFARIYPLHALTLVWMAGLVVVAGGASRDGFLLSVVQQATLVHGWGLSDSYAMNFPSWSISGEALAYLLFPAMAVLALRGGGWLLGLTLAAVAALAAYTWLVEVQGVAWERVAVLRALSGFAIGVVLSQIRGVMTGWSDSQIGRAQLASVAILAVLLHLGAGLGLLVPVFAALVMLTWEDRGPLAWVLRRPVFALLGGLSYSIYLLHVPVRATGYLVWAKLVAPLSEPWSAVAFVLACTVATLVLSWLCYRFFEVPMRRALGPKRGFAPAKLAVATGKV